MASSRFSAPLFPYWNSSPSSTFCNTVLQGSSAYSWKIIPRSEPGPFTGSPPSSTSPSSGCSKPAMSFSRVDFPLPVGPTITRNSFSAISRSHPFTAAIRLPPLRYSFVTPFRAISVGDMLLCPVPLIFSVMIASLYAQIFHAKRLISQRLAESSRYPIRPMMKIVAISWS